MKSGSKCRKCGARLNERSWYPVSISRKDYICKNCLSEYRKKRYVDGRPINEQIVRKCRKCDVVLVFESNWWKTNQRRGNYICNTCDKNQQTERRRSKGMPPRSVAGMGRLGVPVRLPNGERNPKYYRAWANDKGLEPRASNWGNMYGVQHFLPNGMLNPKYHETWRRFHGINPRKLPGQGKLGVPTKLPNGKRNPEYNRLYLQSPEGKIAYSRKSSKRKRSLPTTIVLGKPFKDSNLHHLTPNVAVYIPESLHKSIPHNIWTGKNMDKINVVAMEFYERELVG